MAETRATHFDKKRAWNANCVQTQSGKRVVGFDWLKRELLISSWNANCVQTQKGGRFRLAETRATHFDKKRAWNANCVQTQSGRKGGRFRLAETRATHFDKKRAWNANCVQTQSGGGDGGIRTHVPISGQNDFESFSLRPLRYISKSKRRTI